MGKGATSEAGKYLFRATNVWWGYPQYFVIASCVGVCGNVCCVSAVVKDSGFLSLGVLKYIVCLCKGCVGRCVSVCIVTRGAVGARVWEV